jgi:hypothetical protein
MESERRTYAVPEPVGGGGKGDTTGSDWKRENLADDNPRARAPSGGKHGDVDADECNHGRDGGLVGINSLVLADGDTDDSNDVLGDDHSSSTKDEEVTATNSLNQVEGNWSGAHVYERGDQTDQERVGDGVQTVGKNVSVKSEIQARSEVMRNTYLLKNTTP